MKKNSPLRTTNYVLRTSRGFTLIETLVAVTFLTVAIVAPMSLITKSLSTTYYARDQITASYLAQEAIESIRYVRDNNILASVRGTRTPTFDGIPVGRPFIVDTFSNSIDDDPCNNSTNTCPPLQLDPTKTFYGYGLGWDNTRFTRTVRAEFVDGNPDEMRIQVTVSWTSGSFKPRSFTMSENLYRWIDDSAAE